jgi:hypothetical protein
MQGKPIQREQAEGPLQEGQAQTGALYQISRRLNAARDERELLQVLSWPAIEAGALSAALIYVDLDDSSEPGGWSWSLPGGNGTLGFPLPKDRVSPWSSFPCPACGWTTQTRVNTSGPFDSG